MKLQKGREKMSLREKFRRGMAFALAMLLAFTTVGVEFPTIVRAAEVPATEITSFDNNYGFDGVVYVVNDLLVSKDGGSSFQQLQDGMTLAADDKIAVDLSYYIGNNSDANEFMISFSPVEGLKLSEITTPEVIRFGIEEVGYYTIDASGNIHVKITNASAFSDNKKNGTFQMDGTVDVDASNVDASDNTTVKIGQKTINVVYDSKIAASTVATSKGTTGPVVYDKATDKFFQTFMVTMTAKDGTVSDLNINDTWGAGLSAPTDFKVVANESTGSFAPSYASLADLNAALGASGVTLEKDKTISVQYTQEVNYGANDFNNSEYITYKDNKGKPQQSWTAYSQAAVSKPNVSKNGVINGDDTTITWTITVNLNDYKKILEADTTKKVDDILKTVTDTLSDGHTSTDPIVGTDVTFDASKWTDNGNGVFTYTYTSTMKDEYKNSSSGATFSNDVTITDYKGYPHPAKTATVGKGGSSWIEKAFTNFDRANKVLTWTVTLDPPTSAKEVVLEDQTHEKSGNHGMLKSISIDGVEVYDGTSKLPGASGIVNGDITNYYESSLKFEDSYIAAKADAHQKITVVYQTIVSDASMGGLIYGNRATIKYRDKVTNQPASFNSYAEYQDTGSLLSKEAQTVTGKNSIHYIMKLDLTNYSMTTENIVIKDTLPDNMKLDEGSFSAYLRGRYWRTVPEDNVHYEVNVVGGKNVMTITLPVTSSVITDYNGLKSSDDGSYVGLWFDYTLSVDNVGEFINEGTTTFTNEAEGYYGDIFVGKPSTSTQLTPQDVVSKGHVYDQYTAPNVNYTIEINENAETLIEGGTLTATDKISSALSYVFSSIKVMKYAGGSWQLMTPGTDYKYTYDEATRSLKFTGLPDKTYLKITYKCSVNLPVGAQLDDKNSKNEFNLEGINGNSSKSADSIYQIVVKPKATFESDNGYIILYKYFTEDGSYRSLDGAKFVVNRVVWDSVNSKFVDFVEGGSIVDKSEVTTGADGTVQINKLSVAGIYKLEEVTPPTGFKKADTVYFILDTYNGTEFATLPSTAKAQVKTLGVGKEYKLENKKTEASRSGSVTFEAQKTLDGATPSTGKDFNFAIMQLPNTSANPYDDATMNVKNPSNGTIVSTKVNAGGTVAFDAIPYSTEGNGVGEYYYKIYEQPISSGKAYKNDINIDTSYYIAKVTVTNSSTEGQFDVTPDYVKKYEKSGSTYVEASGIYNETTIPFANTSKAKSGEYTFAASKKIDGATPTVSGFEFNVAQVNENTSSAAVITGKETIATGTSNKGNVTFDNKVSFTNADAGNTYYYKITEKDLPVAMEHDYTKDDSYYIVSLEVVDVEGQANLKVTPTITKYVGGTGSSATAVSFDNKAKTKTATKKFAANKLVNGVNADPTYNDKFTFSLYKLADASDRTGTLVATGTNASSGGESSVTFNSSGSEYQVTYKSDVTGDIGTHYYMIKETAMNASLSDQLSMDDTFYIVKHVVSNDSDSETALKVVETIYKYSAGSATGTVASKATFNNKSTPKATLYFGATKTLDGGVPTKKFKFTVSDLTSVYESKSLSDQAAYLASNPTDGTAISTGENNTSDGKIAFANTITYSAHASADINTHYYKIAEDELSTADQNDYEKEDVYYIAQVTVNFTDPNLTVSKEIYKYTKSGGSYVKSGLPVYSKAYPNMATGTTILSLEPDEIAKVAFANTTKVKNGTISFAAKKQVDAATPDVSLNDKFTFKIDRVQADLTTVIETLRTANNVGENVTFTAFAANYYTTGTITGEQLGVGTYYYKIYEDDIADPAVAADYNKDKSYYIVTVVVSNILGEASLRVTPTYKYYKYNTATNAYNTAKTVTAADVKFNNTSVVKKGKLILEKSIVDLPADVDPTTKIAFTISPAVNSKYVYNLSEFAYNSATKKYTLELADVPVGTYKVRETKYNIDGYILDELKYTVDSVDTIGTDKTVNATVTDGGEKTVYITDTYKADAGKLTLNKSLTGSLGSLTWDEIAKTIHFTIKDSGGNVYKTIDPKTTAFTKIDDYNYTYTLTDVPSGVYTVVESYDTIPGYTVTTTNKVNGTLSATPLQGKATVSATSNPNVSFTNNYKAQPLHLVLKKAITGVTESQSKDLIGDVTFEVYRKTGNTKVAEVTMTAADYVSGVYTKTIEGLGPDSYYVKEVVKNQGSKASTSQIKLTSAAYEVTLNSTKLGSNTKGPDAGATTTTQTNQTAVKYGDTLTFAFTNNYIDESIAPAIRIVKSVDGDLTWDQVKDTISFTIKSKNLSGNKAYDVSDQEIGKITPASHTFTKGADGKYYCTIQLSKTSEKLDNEYIVTETCNMTSLQNYNVVTYYQVGSADSKHRTYTGEVTVKPVASSTIADVIYTNSYAKKYGTLALKKTISGLASEDVSKKDLYKDITFTITPGVDGKSANTVVKLSQFNKDTNGDWVYSFNNVVIGNYTVVESNTDVNGYVYIQTSYVVKATGKADANFDGLTASGAVEDGRTITFVATNTYEQKKGNLILTKTIKGDVTKEEAEGALVFTVKNNDTGVTKTYKLTDFDSYDAATRKYTKTLPTTVGGYTVTETIKDVNGYVLKEVNYAVDGGSKTIGDSATTTVPYNGTRTVDFEDDYAKDEGKLVITKTIKGDVTKEEAEGALQFTVLNNDTGHVDTYKLTDFTYDSVTGKYSKELTATSGGYTVTESIYDIHGYVLKQVTTSVNGGPKEDTNKATTAVTYNNTTTVDFEDEYTKDFGKLVITKTIKGDVTKEEAEGALVFTVKNNATGHIDTYKLTDFVYDSVTGMYKKELDCVSGGYTVSESIFDIAGHAIKTVKYSVNGSTLTNGNQTEVSIVKDQTTTVDFEDDYTDDSAKLLLTKTVWGYPSQAELLDTVKFEVKNNSTGQVFNFTLRDFTYDEVKDYYYKELATVPGGYTVTEYATNVSGLKLVCVAYTIGERENNYNYILEPTVIVELIKDKTYQVNFVNEYRISDWDISTPRKDTTTTITTTTKTTTTTTFTKIPKTGDDTPLKGMVAGAIASLVAGIGCMVIYFKKRKRVR